MNRPGDEEKTHQLIIYFGRGASTGIDFFSSA
jgi:hypothetical protein